MHAQVLDNMWVLYGTQKATLLLKLLHDTCRSWSSKLEEGGVENFSSTGHAYTTLIVKLILHVVGAA